MLYFALEYVLRLWSTSLTYKNFFFDGYNFVDLMSVLPFFIFQFTGASRHHHHEISFITIFRFFRLNRAIDTFQHFQLAKSAKMFLHSLRQSVSSMSLWLIIWIFFIIIFSEAIFWTERGEWDKDERRYYFDGELSEFQSIPISIWWTLQTMTTVGYGDLIPRTSLGKFIASVTMIVGIMTISLPVTIIGINFTNVIQMYKEHQVYDPSIGGEDFEYWIRHSSKQELIRGIEKRNKECQRIITRLGELNV